MSYSHPAANLLMFSTKLKDALESARNDEVLNILLKINDILRNKYDHSKQDYIHFAGPSGSLIKVLECQDCSFECHIEASKALHHLTFTQTDIINDAKLNHCSVFPAEVTASVQRLVISIVKEQCLSSSSFPQIEYMNLIVSCLGILYNLVICAPDEVLGSVILNAAHPFIFYKLPGIKEPKFFDDENELGLSEDQLREIDADNSSRAYTNRNRRKRLRRRRAQPSRSTLQNESPSNSAIGSPIDRVAFTPRTPPSPQSLATLSLKPQWIRGPQNTGCDTKKIHVQSLSSEGNNIDLSGCVAGMKSQLESGSSTDVSTTAFALETPGNNFAIAKDYSDHPDSFGYEERMTAVAVNVRHSALHTINAVIDKAGRQNKFGFWPQLMCQNPSIMTCILRDPSSVVRMGALQLVNTFLVDSQQVLSMAVDDEGGTPSYTTLGRQLGLSIRELHRCLALALISETSASPLVRILKTFELLLQNVKYSSLKPGLLTKVVTHVKYFLRYKEAVVRANAFSVMVSFLMVKPQMPEIRDILLKYPTRVLYPPPGGYVTLAGGVPTPCEEEMPGEEDEEEGEDEEGTCEESFSSDSCTDESSAGSSMVSWILQRCLDSLILQKRESPLQGIYIQVQLQSLKVLSALVSEHLSLIWRSLPHIQRVIQFCCQQMPQEQKMSEALQNLHVTSSGQMEDGLVSSDPDVDVVVEHSYLLLGSLLAAVKNQVETKKVSKHTNNSGDGGEIGDLNCVSHQMALQLWLWALQHPLDILVRITNAKQKEETPPPGSGTATDNGVSDDTFPMKPLVAAANCLSHLGLHVLQSIGDPLLHQLLLIIQHLLENPNLPLQLCGMRVMAIVSGYPPVGDHPLGPHLALTTIHSTTLLLPVKHKNVNKDRLLASWALDNVFSSLRSFRDTASRGSPVGHAPFLSKMTVMTVIKAAIGGCSDKEKIRPHAVRCLGYVVAFLDRDLVDDPDIERAVSESIETLLACCQAGSNMRMRWNTCHALGNILASEHLPIHKVPWRSSVLVTLCSLVERFPNYKVRIQACMALCGLAQQKDGLDQRKSFGLEYTLVWKSFLKGLEDSISISDYQEIQHRDELINQLCIGLCQLVQLVELEDFENLTEPLCLYQDTAKTLLIKTHESLPPEQASCFLRAGETLKKLNNSDTLTATQNKGLNVLLDVFKDFL